jgi:hypothetical protein
MADYNKSLFELQAPLPNSIKLNNSDNFTVIADLFSCAYTNLHHIDQNRIIHASKILMK